MTPFALNARRALILATVLALASCTGDPTTSTSLTYAVGGSVSGLVGSGLMLRINGGDDLVVTANGSFAFAIKLASGTAYTTTVLTQPSSPAQSCIITGGSGTVTSADITTVAITCWTHPLTVGGTVTGLAGSGLVLRDNGGDELAVSGNGPVTFATRVAPDAPYNVTVFRQPTSPAQTCSVTNGSGTMATDNITTVAVACMTVPFFTVGGTVSGLAGAGLVLRDNGGDDLTVSRNGPITFATKVASDAAYAVTVFTQPASPAQSCVVTNGSGTVASENITTVGIACTTDTYTVGGTVTGLAGSGLVLRDNGGDDLAVSANGSFTFATSLASVADYSVTVFAQPTNPAQTCVVTNGSGTVATTNVTNVAVACTIVPVLTVGGSVSGLVGSGLVLRDNGGDDLAVSANGTFTFATKVASGAAYNVTVSTQPTGPAQTCAVTGGSGVVANANVTNVAIACTTGTPQLYAVGGTVTGLAGSGLVLRNNGGDDLAVSADGTFIFGTPLASGAAYSVTVFTQPTSPTQSCVVTNGNGTVTVANIATALIACRTGPPQLYAVGGTVVGLAGSGLVLRNNGGDDLTVTANGAFTFATPLAGGAAYSVTVFSQPTNPAQTCVVTGGSGTVPGAVSVGVGCTTNGSSGTLRVSVTTTGPDVPATDTVWVAGFNSALVTSNGAVSIAVPAGAQTVSLNVAHNCTLTSPNYVSVTVVPGVTTDIAFSVTCVANGALRVAVATTGVDIPATYLVGLDPGPTGYSYAAVVPSNGTGSFAVGSGDHTVYLQVARNCTVTSPNTVLVTVAAGAPTDIAFAVTCGPPGIIQVTVATTGTDAPATYGVQVAEVGYSYYRPTSVPANGTISFERLPGRYSVKLLLPLNCIHRPPPYNPTTVTVASGATTRIGFSVTCGPPATLRVTASTTGPNAPATYSVGVFVNSTGSWDQSTVVSSNGTVSKFLSAGNHSVYLSVPQNCTVASPNPAGVTLVAGATTDLAFTVACQ